MNSLQEFGGDADMEAALGDAEAETIKVCRRHFDHFESFAE